jgi:hypothetical protein
MKDKKLIERMKTLLEYDGETGVFTWKVCRSGTEGKGSVAGWLDNGYIRIMVDGKSYRAHRIAFAFEYGYFPKEIDHKNRNKSDNRIKNLREATPQENSKNKSMSSRNTSGVTGVGWHKGTGKWHARITVDGKLIHLGLYDHIFKAVQARSEANRKYGYYRGHGLNKG